MRPQEKDYASHVAYTRELEVYCDALTTERDECSAESFVWNARYEFACGERKKLLSDNAGLVKNQESNTIAFLDMREERDALELANKDLSNWFDALKADHDRLMAAAKLALEALDYLGYSPDIYVHPDTWISAEAEYAVTALKKAGLK